MGKNIIIIYSSLYKIDLHINIDENVYIGDIYRCTKYNDGSKRFLSYDENANIEKNFTGAYTFNHSSEPFKKNAVLVKLEKDIYVDLFDVVNDLSDYIVRLSRREVKFIVGPDSPVLLNGASMDDSLYVKECTLRKFHYQKGKNTGISENKLNKVKKLCLEHKRVI